MAKEIVKKVEVVKEEIKEVPQFELVEVATQTAVVIKDNSTGTQLTEAQAIVLLLNELQQIKRLLG